jgi:glucosamine--fructose-6-phosphate aminotransferase (isomerizing)
MEKEIHEQPEAISHALSHYVDFLEHKVRPVAGDIDFANVPSLAISACGTAFLAGLVGKYWFERYARLPVEIDVASEFRYREIPLNPASAALFISQSGETADTLASLRYCRENGLKIGAVVNTRESTIARESHAVFPILAGPEIGVASTKAFTCQLTVLAALAVGAGRAGAPSPKRRKRSSCAAWRKCRASCRASSTRSSRRSSSSPASSRSARTCSISAAARATRSPWKAR